MNIQISDHFTYKRLFRFVFPSIGMMIFTSIYGVVDGFFVSNYAGSTPFAAINLVMPFLMIFSALGFMIGTGGTALVSFHLGQGNEKKANEIFSMLVYTVIGIGITSTIFGQIVLEKVALMLGATEEMLPFCLSYGRIFLFALGPFMLQTLFQSFLIVAERQNIGFWVTILAGCINMFLDFLLVGLLSLGVIGAALATSLSMFVGGIIPLIYFILPNKSVLALGRCSFDLRAFLKACGNGTSEFLSNIALNVVAMVYNMQLLKFIGENGVAAYGVIMYVCFVFVAVFIGYTIGVAPIVGFNYGAGNHKELQNIFRKSIIICMSASVLMFLSSEILAKPLAMLYVGYDQQLLAITQYAFRLYFISFLILGVNIFASAFFTALNNGAVSAIISALRTLIFPVAVVMALPYILGINGIWLATTVSESMALVVSVYFFIVMRKHYHY